MLLKKLVVAEDDDAIAHLIGATLGDAGFLCLRAWDGQRAVDLVRTELPDLLVLDLMLPKMDGLEVCRRIKGDVLLSRVPILMLTSMSAVENRVEGLEAGADDYLSKPFDVRELIARVRALIRQSRRERDRNPTTNLPGREAIEDHIAGLLQREQPFTVLHADIEHFRAFADVHGYHKVDQVIRLVGELVFNETRSVAEEQPFVGHVGGDDFIVVCQRGEVADELARQLSEQFPSVVETVCAGSAEASSPSAAVPKRGGSQAPIEEGTATLMALSIARVDVPSRRYASIEALAEDLARIKQASRRRVSADGFSMIAPDKARS